MNKLLRLAAWCELLTGAFMILHVTLKFFSSNSNGALTLSTGVLIALGTLGLFAGTALFRPGMLAWRSSVFLQVLLIPVFLIGDVVFRPGLGVFLPLGVNIPAIGGFSALFEFSLGVDFMVSLRAARGQQYVAINFAALACLAILLCNRPVAGERAELLRYPDCPKMEP